MLRTRPTTVEARHLTTEHQVELARWVNGWTYGTQTIRWFDRDTGLVMSASLGDWIVRTAFGVYRPVQDQLLLREYDRVMPEVSE